MSDESWIIGLMRENYEAVGFIPATTIRDRYVHTGRYAIQRDERGRCVGYILHGAIRAGLPVSITQCCIQYDSRLHGYGESAFGTVLERARLRGASGVRLRCATDLEAMTFWQDQGFVWRDVVAGGASRNRVIARMWLPLGLPLFGSLPMAGSSQGEGV